MMSILKQYKRLLPPLLVISLLAYFLISKPLFVPSWRADISEINNIKKLDLTLQDGTKPTSTPVFGIDVSHDQGDVNWKQVAQSGVGFVYAKASDGITWQDPKFVQNVQDISEQKVPVGPYHFFEANDDPVKQANNYLTTIKNQKLTLAPMVDVEITRDQKPDVIKSRLKTFLETVHKKTGCLPVIYSYKDYWDTNIGPEFNAYPFWLADYSKKMDAPKDVKNLMIWQHSSRGRIPGIKVNVDLDILLEGNKALQQLSCDYSALDGKTAQTTNDLTNGGNHG